MQDKKDIKLKQDFEQWLGESVNSLIDLCGLGAINIHFKAVSEINPPQAWDGGNGSVVFSMNYEKAYKSAFIDYHPIALRMFRQNRVKELFNGLVHEVCHIFTYPMFQLAFNRYVTERAIRDTNEQLTEEIAMVVRQMIQLTRPEMFESFQPQKPILKISKKAEQKVG